MKAFKELAVKVLTYIYGIGIFAALFGGALSILGYMAAFCIGGETATQICTFIYKDYYPVIIYISSVAVLVGLVKMYVAGEKALTSGNGSSKKQAPKPSIQVQEKNQ